MLSHHHWPRSLESRLTLLSMLALLLVTSLVGVRIFAQVSGPQSYLVKSLANVGPMVEVTNTLFFTASDGTNGAELWKSDGTTAGTALVKDLFVGTAGSAPSNLTNVNGTLFFTANDGTNGAELWKSDGTTAGTVLVKDIAPGTTGSAAANFTVLVTNTLFFTANDGTNGTELWKSDGTTAGTVLVKDLYVGGYSATPSSLTSVNGTLFFVAYDGTTYGLWASDGTTAGTSVVKSGIYPSALTVANNTLFFTTNSGLWTSDGTTAGTVEVAGIGTSAYLTAMNNTLFFTAINGTSGKELWKSDGTVGGTGLVKDINPQGFAFDNASPAFTVLTNTLFFVASDGTTGWEVWKSDGTDAGTSLLKNLDPSAVSGSWYPISSYPMGSRPDGLFVAGGLLFFNASDGTATKFWQTDGTSAGTVAVRNQRASGKAFLNNSLFFGASDGLWALPLDGTTPATITGTVTDSSGTPLVGVTVTDGTRRSITDASGKYSLIVPAGSYTLTPTRGGYDFGPVTRDVTVTTGTVSGQDFTATALTANTISGRVVDLNGAPVAGVVITAWMFQPYPSPYPAPGTGTYYNITTSISGTYTLVVPTGSYTLTPGKSDYSFTAATRTVTVPGNNSGQDFTATPLSYTISGRVADLNGTPIAGVTVTVKLTWALAYPSPYPGPGNSGYKVTTNISGTYALVVPAGAYTLTAAKGTYSFTPATRTVSVPAINLSGQDFTAPALTYTVSGQIVDGSGTPLAGVTLSDGTRSTTTTITGTYALDAVPAGNYTLTPTKRGYTFTPVTSAVTVSDNLSGQDFTATALAYTVSGRVVDSRGNALEGVTVADGTRSTTTTISGTYALDAVPAGNYTLTPTKRDYTFTPVTSAVTVSDNLSGQDFTATRQTYTVSGRIVDASGKALAGVTLTVGGQSTTTTSDGNYTLSGLVAGNYTLTPMKSDYTFTPTSRNLPITGKLDGQDFVGASAAQGLVDVSISIYSNPSSTQRVAYEDIVRYFADGVFEQSNGAHKLHTVTIYPSQGLKGRANIEWIASCWPNAHPSGYGVTGLRVEMCESFSGVNFLNDHAAGGYVLAHEWGHYFYALYDEYRGNDTCPAKWPSTPCTSDTPVQNSIMNSQWNARGGNYAWLNFSTALNDTRNTAQYRVYDASGWVTLARLPAHDPRNGMLTNLPKRRYYPELAAVAPQAGQAPRIDLVSNNTARSALQIVWANSGMSLAASQTAITANVAAIDGGQITYPEPIRVLAVLQRDQPIAGAVAEGEIVAPDGITQTVTLRDDGVAPDTRANDGLYAALLTTKQDGAHTIRVRFTNSAGTASEVADSGMLVPPLEGTTPQLPAAQPITDPFEVFSELTVQVTGTQADDHGDTLATATVLAPNGTDAAGQIDRAGDRDLFRLTTISTGKLALRVTDLALGMQPQVRLLASDGTTELARADLSTSASTDYLLLTHTVAAGATVYVEVSHSNLAATQGLYRLSAGTLLTSEGGSAGTSAVYLPMIVR